MRWVSKDAGRRAVAVVVAMLGVGGLAPATASAFSAVTMFSEPGDYIGGGVERIFHPANASISISGTASFFTVGVSGGTRGDSYSLDFAAPPGEQLEEGVYYGAQRASFREAGRPGIDIGGDGRGCNQTTGNFEVTDLETDPATGKVIRVSLVYEQHCEGGLPALFGEVRYGYTAPTGPAAIPTRVRWPVAELQDPST
ncbi:MAG: hypothetical protein M3320_09515, partial [Actinomycetota bacterium]|nr:hypothetical protein [Actinomycetota bacterium]